MECKNGTCKVLAGSRGEGQERKRLLDFALKGELPIQKTIRDILRR